jgi:hypothetical protein
MDVDAASILRRDADAEVGGKVIAIEGDPSVMFSSYRASPPVDLRGLLASSVRRASIMPAVARASRLRICANAPLLVFGSAVVALDMVSL